MTARILMLASRLDRHPWTHGALVARLTRALAGPARRCDVTLLCDAAEDVDAFSCRVRAMRPFEHNLAERPAPVARWLERTADRIERDVTVSLTRLAPAQVWMPLDPSAEAILADELAARPALSRAMWLARHAALLTGRSAEREAAQREDLVERVLAFGPTASNAARRRWVRLGARVRDVGFAAMVPPIGSRDERRLREHVRARLHINHARRVVLVSLMRTAGPDLDAFLAALATVTAPEVRSGAAPVVVAVARDPYAVHDAACRAGCQRALRIVGQTGRMDTLLAAADAAAAPLAAGPDPFSAGATGRFIADALRAGRPVLAVPGASGEDLLEHRGVEAPGAVVRPAADAWADALRRLCDDDWLAARAVGAKAAGMGLGFDDWAERVGGLLLNGAA